MSLPAVTNGNQERLPLGDFVGLGDIVPDETIRGVYLTINLLFQRVRLLAGLSLIRPSPFSSTSVPTISTCLRPAWLRIVHAFFASPNKSPISIQMTMSGGSISVARATP